MGVSEVRIRKASERVAGRSDGMSYIVPSERPRTCGVCPFARLSQINYGKCWCALDSTNTRSYANSYEKLDNCPLIEIPTPHGELIDRDALKNDMRDWNPSIIAVVDARPTVIEAEGSEE